MCVAIAWNVHGRSWKVRGAGEALVHTFFFGGAALALPLPLEVAALPPAAAALPLPLGAGLDAAAAALAACAAETFLSFLSAGGPAMAAGSLNVGVALRQRSSERSIQRSCCNRASTCRSRGHRGFIEGRTRGHRGFIEGTSMSEGSFDGSCCCPREYLLAHRVLLLRAEGVDELAQPIDGVEEGEADLSKEPGDTDG